MLGSQVLLAYMASSHNTVCRSTKLATLSPRLLNSPPYALKALVAQGLVLRRRLADYQPQRVLYVGDAGFVFQNLKFLFDKLLEVRVAGLT